MKYIVTLAIFIIAGFGIYQIINQPNPPLDTNQENNQTTGTSTVITFPSGGEDFRVGQTYTLRWTDGADTVDIFLIDTSLESEGVSVSIVDRIYGIKNISSYEYRIPETMKLGNYRFQVGDTTSGIFRIVKN